MADDAPSRPTAFSVRTAVFIRLLQTAEYRSYVNAKTLCRNPKRPQWRYYGGRGIEFRLPPFAVFLEHLGRRPAGKILDRIYRDGHFEIGNVYWRRKRRKKRRTPKGKTRKPPRIVVQKRPREKPVIVCGHHERRRLRASIRKCRAICSDQ